MRIERTEPPWVAGYATPVRRSRWRVFGILILTAVEWSAAAAALSVGLSCGLAAYRGESADPRCALGRPGYTTLHTLGAHTERVSCQYREALLPAAELRSGARPGYSPPVAERLPTPGQHN